MESMGETFCDTPETLGLHIKETLDRIKAGHKPRTYAIQFQVIDTDLGYRFTCAVFNQDEVERFGALINSFDRVRKEMP
jgi:hypothetical protein